MKIQLKGRAIPRRGDGDPSFATLTGVQSVFKDEEIVELVNRALYQLEYQKAAHRERGRRVRDKEKLIKQKVKELFHVSWMKATEEQVRKAREEVEKG